MPIIPFTDRAVGALSNPGEVVDYWDANYPGLALRVSQRGRKAWLVRYRVGKTQRRLMLGYYPDMSLLDARRLAGVKMAQTEDGQDPALQERAETKRQATLAAMERDNALVTVRQMANDYLERHAKPNKKSWKNDDQIIKAAIIPAWGDLSPKDVTRTHVVKLLHAAIDRGANYQANRTLEVVRKIFNWGAGIYVDQSPCYGIRKPTKEVPRERNLSKAELREIWTLIEGGRVDEDGRRTWMEEPIRIALKLLLLLGQRPGEVADAPKAEFDLDEAVWTIPGERVKNGRLHRVPLPPLAVRLIKRAIAISGESAFLFPTPSWTKDGEPGVKPIGRTALSHALKRVLAGGTIKDVRPYDFRETVATGMAELGVDEAAIGAVLNHLQPTVTRRHYNRYRYEKEKRAGLEAWEGELLRIVSPERRPKKAAAVL